MRQLYLANQFIMTTQEEKPSGNNPDNDSASLSARRARLRGSLAKAAPPPPPDTSKDTSVLANLDLSSSQDDPGISQESVSSEPPSVQEVASAANNAAQAAEESQGLASILSAWGDYEQEEVEQAPQAVQQEVSLAADIQITAAEISVSMPDLAPISTEPQDMPVPQQEVSAAVVEVKQAVETVEVPAKAPEVSPQVLMSAEQINTLSEAMQSCVSAIKELPKKLNKGSASADKVSEQKIDQLETSIKSCVELIANSPDKTSAILERVDQVLGQVASHLGVLKDINQEQAKVLQDLSVSIKTQRTSESHSNVDSLTEAISAAIEPMRSVGELIPVVDQLVTTLESSNANKDEGVKKISQEELVASLSDQLCSGLIDPWTFKCAYMAVFPADHPADLLHRLVELLGTQRLSGDLFRAAYEAVQAAEPPASRKTSKRSADEEAAYASASDPEIQSQLDELRQANEEMRKMLDARENEFMHMLSTREKELEASQEALAGQYEELKAQYEATVATLSEREEEISQAIANREEELKSKLEDKDQQIIEKDSELNMLRAQMEELRSQTHDMVSQMQKQMADLKSAKEQEEAPSKKGSKKSTSAQSGFFDNGPKQASVNVPFFESAAEPAPSEPAVEETPQDSQQQAQSEEASAQPIAQIEQAAAGQGQQSGQPYVRPPGGLSAGLMPQSVEAQSQSRQSVSVQGLGQMGGGQRPPGPVTQALGGAGGVGSYGSGVRAQVFEVIVRQALAGAPWREICAGPMQVNNITPEEVEAEVQRRKQFLAQK